MDDQGREVTMMESAPDNFGRNVRLSRTVTPRRDGTFKNDTTYTANFMSGNHLDGRSFQSVSGVQYGLSPKQSINKPFNKWGEYFKHVQSLQQKQAAQNNAGSPYFGNFENQVDETPTYSKAQSAGRRSNYYTSMAF